MVLLSFYSVFYLFIYHLLIYLFIIYLFLYAGIYVTMADLKLIILLPLSLLGVCYSTWLFPTVVFQISTLCVQ